MTTLMQASHQWASRPHDERYLSLLDMRDFMRQQRQSSSSRVISSCELHAVPDETDPRRGLLIEGPDGLMEPTHWSFGQLAALVGAPAEYLRNRLPSPIVADCLNYGFRFGRDVEEISTLCTARNAGMADELRAATGPRYGRVWNVELIEALIERFGDGVTGTWRVPGEFGKDVQVNKSNTTLYASDRDCFVFLADERNRIEIPERRAGMHGTFARGFFCWNSEVGAATLGCAFFLFDYVCSNRIVWDARDFNEIRIRHTSGAPDRWLEEVVPVLNEYADASAKPVQQCIENARNRRLDDLDDFLGKRFGKRMTADIRAVHELEEHRPIETLWDVTTAVTALARNIPHQDRRVELEREAGKVLQLAA